MADITSLSLQDVAPLEALGRIAEEYRTELVLHGSTASRLAMYLSYRSTEPDLFDLVPFSSDIDLDHSGPPELTAQLLRSIEEQVPFASWFRWSINHRGRSQAAAEIRTSSTYVPLRSIRISTARSRPLPLQAQRDLDDRVVSIFRNPYYGQSQLVRQNRDVESFGILMGLNAAADMGEIAEPHQPASIRIVGDWLPPALPLSTRLISPGLVGLLEQDLGKIIQSSQLSARFWSLFVQRLARAGWDDTNQAIVQAMVSVIAKLGVDPSSLREPGRCFGVSQTMPDGAFRLRELACRIYTGDAARGAFADLFSRYRSISKAELPTDPQDVLDSAFELLAVIPDFAIAAVDSARNDNPADVFFSDGVAFGDAVKPEFVEFAWQHPPGQRLEAQEITAQAFTRHDFVSGVTSPLPAVGGVFRGGRPWVRIRVDGLGGSEDGKATLVILQRRRTNA